MRYTWDPEKDTLNRRKHGLPLAAGTAALEGPDRDSWIDDRFDYEEERVITLGMSSQKILHVVSTCGGKELTRLISVRRAEVNEIQRYLLGRS